MKKLTYLLAIAAFATSGKAQNMISPIQSQTIPAMSYNSLAGWHGGLQANALYYDVSPFSVNYFINTDYYSPKLKGAFGFNANHSNINVGTINDNTVQACYTQRFKIGEVAIAPSVSIGLYQTSVAWGKLIGMPYYDSALVSNPPITNNLNYLTVNAGVGGFYKSFYGAIQVSNINRPDVSFFRNTEARIPLNMAFVGGWNKQIGDWTLSPSAQFSSYGQFSYLSGTFNAIWKNINAGVKYETNDMLSLAAGYDIKGNARLAYSYSINTSRIARGSAPTHALSVRVWLMKESRKEHKLINNLGIL